MNRILDWHTSSSDIIIIYCRSRGEVDVKFREKIRDLIEFYNNNSNGMIFNLCSLFIHIRTEKFTQLYRENFPQENFSCYQLEVGLKDKTE